MSLTFVPITHQFVVYMETMPEKGKLVRASDSPVLGRGN